MAKLGTQRQTKSKTLPKDTGREKNIPTTFRLIGKLKIKMQKDVIDQGYGLKGKSRWGRDAIHGFLNDPSWKDQLLDTEMIGGHEEKDVFYLTKDDRDDLITATNEVLAYAIEMTQRGIRQESIGELKITATSIIRAAINWQVFDLKMIKVPSNKELPLDTS
ncbi:MAG: hypothetical protein RPU12_10630 [Candidatus Sedimenticola sp. (ex Thyasira tokunagai)]